MFNNKIPVAVAIGVCALFFSCKLFPEIHHQHSFYRLDTIIQVTIVAPKTDTRIAPLWAGIDSILDAWDQRFSNTKPQSEILGINTRTTPCVTISSDLTTLLQSAYELAPITNNQFDFTILPLKELWHLGERDTINDTTTPSSEAIKRAIALIDYNKVHLDSGTRQLCFDQPDIKIDAGGLAKAGALTSVKKYLLNAGYSNILIASGDILASGKRSDGKAWRIGIQHPRKERLLAAVDLDSGVIFTSGDYERFWITPQGKRVHHIFNPHTGYSETANQSVTIWSMSTMKAKIFSTGLFGLSADSILTIAKQQHCSALVVDSTGTVHISDTWKDHISMMQN